MGTVLSFTADGRDRVAEAPRDVAPCEIVIFPGVRIERLGPQAGPDSGEPPPGTGNLDGTSGRRRRKTSSG